MSIEERRNEYRQAEKRRAEQRRPAKIALAVIAVLILIGVAWNALHSTKPASATPADRAMAGVCSDFYKMMTTVENGSATDATLETAAGGIYIKAAADEYQYGEGLEQPAKALLDALKKSSGVTVAAAPMSSACDRVADSIEGR